MTNPEMRSEHPRDRHLHRALLKKKGLITLSFHIMMESNGSSAISSKMLRSIIIIAPFIPSIIERGVVRNQYGSVYGRFGTSQDCLALLRDCMGA